MKKLFTIALILGALFVSCTVDYNYSTVVELKSELSNDIELLGAEDNLISTITSKGSVKFRDDTESGLHSPYTLLRSINGVNSIVFNGKVRIALDNFALKDVDNYEIVKNKKTSRYYRYTFTDEDYQYALEHGTKLELGE